MGIKSKSNAMNMPSQITVEDLIFSPVSGYYSLKNIDTNANQLVDAIKSGSLDMKEFFSRFDKVKVKETYPDACEKLDEIFYNILKLYVINDRDYFKTELDFSAYFHSLIDLEFFDN